ncbi:CRISPR-associated protein [Candidatus Contubernalis alkaliaceticus]|uniref:CRISPR-associated protein n=1 Tax=Candidatus Contubernalis alkaliaceticus TaxID=338645 RepID=UPI001F4BF612|nr:type I CRISPR-associated protein Cas7 [Candidatus Contubernalis alkalaceticus]UNC93174.1 type I CRISPR-associated protein Cas7 [Candidatus Contubernalis alkalaceticus]
MSSINTSEIIFVKSVKDGIPNRDPLAESDARRLFGEEDGRISLSDVSIKRDVRDYVLAKYPDGGKENRFHVFVRQERTQEGKLLGRKSLAEKILEKVASKDAKNKQEELLKASFDMRIFGAVYSVEKENFSQTGPVQFGWAHSMHPVETKYVQGTVVMPSRDVKITSEGKEEGAGQGTIWTIFTLPFAVFSMPAVINGNIAKDTGMNQEDVNMLLEGLWFGTLNRQARGRGMQKPLYLLQVEYNDPFFRIGYLEEYISLLPEREQWQSGRIPTSVEGITLDVTKLAEILSKYSDKIASLKLKVQDGLQVKGVLPVEADEPF